MPSSINRHQFDLLKDCKKIVHGTYSRKGGVSAAPFDSLHLGTGSDLAANLERVKKHSSIKHIALAKQEHGSTVVEVKRSSDPTPICDALMTQCSDIGLLIRHADCQAALFYDPIQSAIAAVHSGWKGSVLNIYSNVIAELKHKYGSNPENILACISPSLGPKSAEFIHYQKELPRPFWDFQVEKNHFDFWKISRWQLEESGILPHHIEIAEIDTVANPTDYFSYRRNQITGRNGTIISLK